jgi:hypothetical protein
MNGGSTWPRLVLLAMALVGALLAVSCGGDDNKSTSVNPAVSPTSTPAATAATAVATSPGACPAEAICSDARQLLDALNRHDADAILGRMQIQEFTCPGGPAIGDGSPYPLCDGATAGEKRSGYREANSVTFVVVSRDQQAQGLALGPGAAPWVWSLRTIGCPPAAGQTPCASRGLVVAAPQGTGARDYFIFDLSVGTGDWAIGLVTGGPLFQSQLDQALQDGGTVATESHSSVPAGTVYYRMN